ncbi:MAG: hypothetical protein HZC39_13120 [Chloroflexi bacterium]|nr:hypothetical protein [Chloroflexota bacterium]MBI5704467.1 hypothetical protein [Chloroflexota bacterium]GER78823.1 conserved hypothetical protein [Candidatus Denitrolinea symbiosum]
MRRLILPLLLTLTLILAACAPAQDASLQTDPKPASVSTEPAQADAGPLTRIDQQGAIVVAVTPLNLDNPSTQLEFEVVMDTHSVDLSMDLAVLATLTTDTGITVQATLWDAPRGGHHVAGKLIFPSMKDGTSVLEGAGKLTLTITDVDVPTRTFEWELQ